jgi:hypothetical protein
MCVFQIVEFDSISPFPMDDGIDSVFTIWPAPPLSTEKGKMGSM